MSFPKIRRSGHRRPSGRGALMPEVTFGLKPVEVLALDGLRSVHKVLKPEEVGGGSDLFVDDAAHGDSGTPLLNLISFRSRQSFVRPARMASCCASISSPLRIESASASFSARYLISAPTVPNPRGGIFSVSSVSRRSISSYLCLSEATCASNSVMSWGLSPSG